MPELLDSHAITCMHLNVFFSLLAKTLGISCVLTLKKLRTLQILL